MITKDEQAAMMVLMRIGEKYLRDFPPASQVCNLYHPNIKAMLEPLALMEVWERVLDAVEVPEGCTVADARALRSANHDLAIEIDQLRAALQQYAPQHYLLADAGNQKPSNMGG